VQQRSYFNGVSPISFSVVLENPLYQSPKFKRRGWVKSILKWRAGSENIPREHGCPRSGPAIPFLETAGAILGDFFPNLGRNFLVDVLPG
jgi:hypothetical protein